MRRICVLINNRTIGGAERRYARLFFQLAATEPATMVVINRSLVERLRQADVIAPAEERLWVLAEPCAWIVDHCGLAGTVLGLWLAKLDYIGFALLFLLSYGLAKPCVFHVVLGGLYCVLPLQWVARHHRYLGSLVNPDSRQTVGSWFALPFYLAAARRMDVVEALTDRVKDEMIHWGVDGGRISVPTGSVVDLTHFRPLEKDCDVVFAGRLVDEKNPLLCLEAFARIAARRPGVRLFLLGEGPLSDRVREHAERLGLGKSVHMGYVPDLAPTLGRARIFVSLQWQDNYPSQSLLEAMACGAVPVATDVGLTWKLVDDETGVRVPPEPDAISAAVVALLDDADRCARLGRAARRRVSASHSEAQYLEHLGRLYAALGYDPGSAMQPYRPVRSTS